MGSRGMYWLIGAKIACCGALLLVLSGVLSLGALSAFFSGSALPLAGAAAAVVALFLWHRSGHPSPEFSDAENDPQVDRHRGGMQMAEGVSVGRDRSASAARRLATHSLGYTSQRSFETLNPLDHLGGFLRYWAREGPTENNLV